MCCQSRLEQTRHDVQLSEALSRVIGGSLAHSSHNVASPWLAKHLLLHDSRFRFAHDVPDWNYSVNWPHVVVSRVRTLQGLFIGKKLDPSKDHAVPAELQRLMRFFHSHEKPASFDAALPNLDTPV